MGSPLSPTFANFFMDEFEKTNMEFEKLGERCWYRYLDDTFVLMDKGGSPDELLRIMNKKHSNMQFTVEHEKNKKIPFLDALVHLSNLGFSTSVYHKPTFTGVYLNWSSLTSRVYKIGLIKCLLGRTWRICSNFEFIHKEFMFIKETLIRNGYPPEVVD